MASVFFTHQIHPFRPMFAQPEPIPCLPRNNDDVLLFRYQPEPQGKVSRMVSWCPPPEGWVKINTDGAYKKSINLASAGGLIRNSKGSWITGFAANLDCYTSALEAEFVGIVEGLELAWNMGFRKVILESDCKAALDFMRREKDNEGGDEVIQRIKQLIHFEWEVQLQHQFREGNQAADCLANFGIQFPPGRYVLFGGNPPITVIEHIVSGIKGVQYPRFSSCSR